MIPDVIIILIIIYFFLKGDVIRFFLKRIKISTAIISKIETNFRSLESSKFF